MEAMQGTRNAPDAKSIWQMTDKELMRKYERMVYKMAHSMHNKTGVDFDTLCSAGWHGFSIAYDNYCTRRGTKFSSYAFECIRGRILQEIRDMYKIDKKTEQYISELDEHDTFAECAAEGIAFLEELKSQLSEDASTLVDLLVNPPEELLEQMSGTSPKRLIPASMRYLKWNTTRGQTAVIAIKKALRKC
jgi:RNA polymerase sigma factor (sigma-70 family)